MKTRLVLSAVLIGMGTIATSAATVAADFSDQVIARVNALMGVEAGAGRNAINTNRKDLIDLSNYVATHAGVRQSGAMVYCEGALGVFELVESSRTREPGEMLARFSEHPGFMRELGLLWLPEDDAAGVLALADRLMRERSDAVEAFPALAAAICVVHDGQGGDQYTVRINENNPEASDPVQIFDYFVSNSRSMSMALDQMPAIALVYVVDVTEDPAQLQWALNRYGKNPTIGDRFFEIEYDYLHFQQNKDKRVTAEPGEYNLEKIKRWGGVCADQAYFAMSVAKACGIPSAYVVARGADVSHAWVGFVETRGRRAWWNFDAGRYEEYQKLRGNLLNPQTGEWISDGRLGVLSNAIAVDNELVLASLASAQVVERMQRGGWTTSEEMDLDTRGNARVAMTDSIEDRLSFLRAALSKCAGVPRAWDQVVALSRSGQMDQKQLDVWARASIQLAGRQYQDFAYDFLVDLIGSEKDPKQQHEMYEWMFGQFRSRPDLAAGVRFQQGALWAQNDNLEYAWLAYKDVVDQFINEGPMVVSALSGMRELLKASNKDAEIIPILVTATKRVKRPEDMSTQFARQSNYFRIHMMLADAYSKSGQSGEAQRIRRMLGQ